MIEQFLECTTRSWNAEPLFRPENAGRSTRKRSNRQCSTRGHITRPENQKLSLSSGCHNFVISSPILIFFFKHYLCSKRNISIWVLITYHPYICPRMEKTIIVYIINTLLHSYVKILKNHLIHVKYIFDAYEIGMKCISNSLPKSILSDRNQASYPISIQILSNIYPNRIDFG